MISNIIQDDGNQIVPLSKSADLTSSRLDSRIVLARHRQILHSAIETGIITLNRNGLVTGWSEGARHILGWTEQEMLGESLGRIFPAPDGGEHVLRAEMIDATSMGRGGHEGWRLRKSGDQFWAAGEMTPLFDHPPEPIGFVKILCDLTDKRQSEINLLQETRVLEILNQTSATLSRENNLEVIVQAVTDAGVALTEAEFGAFFYNVTNDTGESYMLYTLSGAPHEAFSKFPMPRNTEVFAPTFSGAGIVRSDDITRDSRYGKNAPGEGMPKGHLPVRSYLAVPVVSRSGAVLGGLFFGHSKSSVFNEHSERSLGGLAGEAAIAIDNVRLLEAKQREITEREQAEAALRDLNRNLEDEIKKRTDELHTAGEALRQAQKMEAVGQLTGGIAHDFNNLLQIIVGNLETLLRNLPQDMPKLLRSSNQAMTGARRAAALTQRLLAFARRQPLDPKSIDANALIQSMSDLLTRSLGETVQLKTVLGAGLWKTEADPNELESALLNLAVNARDAMPRGGKLTIETSNTHIDEAYALRHAEVMPGQYVLICVSDTGIGMDHNTISHVFEPFFTTKAEGKGTGLGLSQVYGFVKQSRGHVKIYSELGQGTTVKIYLSRLIGASVAEEEQHNLLSPEAASGETVLVVEDDPDVRAYSVETLSDLGYRVIEACDGPSAISALKADRVDLIFTDVVLPGGATGAEIVSQAKSLQPQVKALFTTGYARNAIVHHGRLDQGVHLITKPFTYDELAAKVRDVLDRDA